jgi:hypothetical protein
MVNLTPEQFEAAKERGEETRRRGPLAESARYDPERNRIIVRLNTGAEIEFDSADAQGLENATPADLKNIEIVEFGLGLHWPTLDADHWVPALAEGMLGSDKWMEQRRAARAARATPRASRTNQHVVPHQGKWAVKGEGNQRATSIHETQAEATKRARDLARRQKSELLVHGRDGEILFREPFGHAGKGRRDTKHI